MQMKVAATHDGVVQVRLSGRIAPDRFEEGHDPLVGLLGPDVFSKQVDLLFDDCDFLSSSGIGWILHCHKRFEQQGGRLQLRSIPRAIDQVLRLMRLEKVLHLC